MCVSQCESVREYGLCLGTGKDKALSLSHHNKPVGRPIVGRSLSDSERRPERGLYCPVLVCL